MKEININVLKDASKKLMFDMEEEQFNTLLKEFEIIQKQMELISKIPGVDDVTPMTFPYEIKTTFLREDVASKPLNRDDALKNAGDVVDGQIRLPKVVG